jgi:hypothetical protein
MSVRRSTLAAVVSLCALVGALLSCSSSALAFRGHVFGSVFGEPCSGEPCGNGQFKEPSGVAVNEETGWVYVVDKGDERVERFSSAGAYEAQFNGSETPAKALVLHGSNGIAVDNSCYFKHLTGSACEAADPSNGDVYVVDDRGPQEPNSNGVVDKFTPEGVYLGQLQVASGGAPFPFHYPIAVGVDASGSVWVEFFYPGAGLNAQVSSFADAKESTFVSGATLPFFGAEVGQSFAVDSEDDFYVNGDKFDSSGQYLIKNFCEGGAVAAVDLASNELFLDEGGFVGACSASGTFEERFGAGDLIGGSGLAVSHARETVYAADATLDVVDVFPPEPASKPLVKSESVSNVTGDSATLQAEVNPHGASTEYTFEYGVCATVAACVSSAYEASAPAPEGFAGAGFASDSVSVNPQTLRAGTVYHFRVVLHNEFGTVDGEGQTFTTQTANGGSGLLDGRAWELVTPPEKRGAALSDINEHEEIQASAGGDAFTIEAYSPTEADPPGFSISEQLFSTRGPGGWVARDIGVPHEQATGLSIGQGSEYRIFSEDLSRAVTQPFGSFIPSSSPWALSPKEASEQTAFLRTDYLNGEVSRPCLESCYRPLVTGKQGYANVAPGTAFSEERGGECPTIMCGPRFVGASPDLRHVVLTIENGVELTPGGGSLYEWNEGVLTPLGNAVLGFESKMARHAVSDDGSRVVLSAGGEGAIYLRDTVKDKTVPLGGGVFQTASSDGSRVFFSNSTGLYECEIVEAMGGELECKLSDLTPNGLLLGNVLGASEDGQWLYFVSTAVLAAGEGAVSGDPNLYVWHDGGTKLVAVLSEKDSPSWDRGTGGDLKEMTARVSPDGQWLAFMSQRDLTGYDTRDAVSGQPDEEVYLYSAASGRLVCPSCNPSGARPVGVEYKELDGKLVGGDRVWDSSTWIAANIPGWTPYTTSGTLYQSRYLSGDGRLFFNSGDALVSQDVNGTEDVYEYEPAGYTNAEGKVQCTPGSTGFSEGSDGCVGLVSSGTSAEESAFVDASETGGDVFFLTAAKLAPQDFDTAIDVYDAHECTAAAPCLPVAAGVPPPCDTGDACKPGPTPQPSIYGSPSSETFSGAGNIVPSAPGASQPKGLTRAQKLARARQACSKEKRKRRAVCERQAKRRYGTAARSRKASATKRGGGR